MSFLNRQREGANLTVTDNNSGVPLVLHHYPSSNFSEKVRLVLGLKALPWMSVTIPQTAPKPDFEPLTGGFRRTPALQIGADVYCDSRLIAIELERRHPTPTLFPGPWPAQSHADCDVLSAWAEDRLLWPLALYITGKHAERYPAAFHEDRARLHGKPTPSPAQVRRAAVRREPEVKRLLACVETLLPDDADFLKGDAPALADFILYHPLWFLERIGGPSALLRSLPKAKRWMARIAAIGAGIPTGREPGWALAHARESYAGDLEALGVHTPEPNLAVGAAVTVAAATEHAHANGTLVHLDNERVVISHDNERVGRVHVHFPRDGYVVRAEG